MYLFIFENGQLEVKVGVMHSFHLKSLAVIATYFKIAIYNDESQINDNIMC